MNNLIDVKDRLPDFGQIVRICYQKENGAFGYCPAGRVAPTVPGGTWLWIGEQAFFPDEVKYWMPLPMQTAA